MGLLDDAIREHLELKRRRGADPTEIERLEREALGPYRRPGYEASEMAVADEVVPGMSEPEDQATEYWSAPDDEADFADHDAEILREAEDWGASDIADTVLEPDAAPPVMPPPDQRPPEHGLAYEDEFREEDTVEHDTEDEYAVDPERAYSDRPDRTYPELPADDYPEPQERGQPAPPDHGGPPDPEHDYREQPEQEDMLEETPEFLQDAPDHDRLWFEQRPPRDFDLDG